ncbi:hypothetical protein RI367_008238 [Sorochytrium milnesiophthora]
MTEADFTGRQQHQHSRPFSSHVPDFLRHKLSGMSASSSSLSSDPASTLAMALDAQPPFSDFSTTCLSPFRHVRKLYQWYWPTSAAHSLWAERHILDHYVPGWRRWLDAAAASMAASTESGVAPYVADVTVTQPAVDDKVDPDKDLLRFAQDIPAPFSTTTASTAARRFQNEGIHARIGFVDVNTHDVDSAQRHHRYINTLIMQPANLQPGDKPGKSVVLTHGYGGGLAMWYKNLGPLGSTLVPQGYSVYAVDWAGMGRSSRVPFPVRARKLSVDGFVDEVEDFFIDSLEEWRKKVGIDQMILVGHSLGGLLSSAYALKYPDRVEKLILVSPAGVPQPPDEAQRRRIPRWATTLWQNNITPFSILRSLGPFGPRLVQMYTDRRFEHLEPDEITSLKEYIFHINADHPSGELALNALLLPGGWAHKPVGDRLVDGLRVPVAFLYGDVDWMNHRHADALLPRLRVPGLVTVVPKAGHHLYLDNPDYFNRELLDIITNWPLSSSPPPSSPPSSS